jgi:hypothetical protein
MHSAPSVIYPVGRCAFQRLVFALLLFVSAALLSVWVYLQPLSQPMFVSGFCFALAMGCGGWGWSSLRRSGSLIWDGNAWCLQGLHAHDQLGELRVTLDFQKVLLLYWEPISSRKQAWSMWPNSFSSPSWLWLAQDQSPALWADLRRAAYQRTQMN